MTESVFMLNVIFTMGALLSIVKVKEVARIWGVEHRYLASFILHVVAGRVGFSLIHYTSLPVNGATQYFTVVATMAGLWMAITLAGVCVGIAHHILLKFVPSV